MLQRLHSNAAAKCWAHKIVLASMSSMKTAGALLLVTPLLLNKYPPIGCATIRQSRIPRRGQDLVVAGDLLESGGV